MPRIPVIAADREGFRTYFHPPRLASIPAGARIFMVRDDRAGDLRNAAHLDTSAGRPQSPLVRGSPQTDNGSVHDQDQEWHLFTRRSTSRAQARALYEDFIYSLKRLLDPRLRYPACLVRARRGLARARRRGDEGARFDYDKNRLLEAVDPIPAHPAQANRLPPGLRAAHEPTSAVAAK